MATQIVGMSAQVTTTPFVQTFMAAAGTNGSALSSTLVTSGVALVNVGPGNAQYRIDNGDWVILDRNEGNYIPADLSVNRLSVKLLNDGATSAKIEYVTESLPSSYVGLNGESFPVATPPVRITGYRYLGNIATAVPGTGYGFTAGQWYRNGVAIAGQTALTYTRVSADVGTTLTFIPSGIAYTAQGGVTIEETGGMTILSSADVIGDSIVANGENSTSGQTSLSHIGVINDLERLAGRNGIDVIGFRAVGGTTIQQCLATQLPAAIASSGAMIIVHSGVNSYNDSITGGGANFTQAMNIASHVTLIQQAAASGKFVFVDPIHPVGQTGTSGARFRASEFPGHNDAIAAECARHPNVRYRGESWTIFVDPGSGVNDPKVNYVQSVDKIHPTTLGARAWGEGIRVSMLSGITILPYKAESATNLVSAFSATGGTATPGTGSITGTANIPLNYNVQVISNSAAVVVSQPSAGVVRLAISNTAGTASTVYLQYSQTAALFASVSAGDVLRCGVQFSVTGAVKLTRVAVTARENGGAPTWNAMQRDTTLEPDAVFVYDQTDQSGRRWTHPRTIPVGTTGLEFIIGVNVGPTDGAVVIDFSNPVFKKLI